MDIGSKIIQRQISSATRPNVSRAREKSASRFSSAVGAQEGITQTQQAFSVNALDSIFLNYNERGNNARQAITYADQILDELENLHRMLISQTISPEILTRLTQILQQRPLVNLPPELSDLVTEIQIRAAVELAKLEKL